MGASEKQHAAGLFDRRHSVGEGDHQQRYEPQHGRPVGDDQQQGHHPAGDRQQVDIGAGERVRDIRAERRSAGHIGDQAAGQAVLGGGP